METKGTIEINRQRLDPIFSISLSLSASWIKMCRVLLFLHRVRTVFPLSAIRTIFNSYCNSSSHAGAANVVSFVQWFASAHSHRIAIPGHAASAAERGRFAREENNKKVNEKQREKERKKERKLVGWLVVRHHCPTHQHLQRAL